MNKYKELINYIKKAENILIISHVNPDGDTLGSMLALKSIIKNDFKKEADAVTFGIIPEIYEFLPGVKDVLKFADLKDSYDLAISVDVASKERMMEALSVFQNAKISVNIDHHKTNKGFGNLNIIDDSASSTGEVIFDIIKSENLTLDKDTACAIYTAVLTDTGGFRFENTNEKVLIIASELVKCGANPNEIARSCYESKSKAQVMLHANTIANAKFEHNGKIAYAIITNDDIKKYNANQSHTDGISEALRQIKTVEVSMLIKEIDSQSCKASLRSKSVDLCKVTEPFSGGGHKFAAGCTIKKPAKIAAQKLIEEIEKYL